MSSHSAELHTWRTLHHIEADDEEWDRRLGHEGEHELRCRESAVGELDQIRGEVERRENDRSQRDEHGESVGDLLSFAFHDHALTHTA
jgi:hypothetical protein